MNILVLGSGGREHAIAWKLAQSRRVQKIFVAPGNGGTALDRALENVPIDAAKDPEAAADFAQKHGIAMTVVGPEAPLAAGVVDIFRERGLKIFGPTKRAAQLESSKDFAKQFMQRHGIPTAQFRTFSDAAAARAYVESRGAPIVVKADGLAAGKGVVVALTIAQAHAAIDAMLVGNQFGNAGARVVIEDFLEGEEASFIVMSDGEHAFALATSQDHKRVGNGDTGPNTGGMGAYSPAPVVTPQVHARVMREVIRPVLAGMKAEGSTYTGFLYAGLMINAKGEPHVVEFNCRMGDPETQPIFLRMRGDFTVLLEHAVNGTLHEAESMADMLWDPRPAVGVVLAAERYPESPRVGDEIQGLPPDSPEAMVFHAGTALRDGKLVTSGGRVLCATALGGTLKDAQDKAYALVRQIHFAGMHYRSDIGWRGLK
ncbi:MAG: phosphoribosylamine--glycine ligase [Betaproteobacteria bacterium]|nr:phosphoribosylamine--glycine ligase [Betaproteobacteria bacterium]